MPEIGEVAAGLLDWLAGLMSVPMSVDTVAACRSCDGVALFEAISDELGPMPGVDAMRSVFDSNESDARLAARLAGCYTRLFEGPGGPATVSLYESTYQGPAHRLHQEAAAAMDSVLRRCGMGVRAGCNEPPDHLSIEVALLATLLRIGDEEAADELRLRLLKWVPRAIAACATTDPTGFYRGALIAVHDTLTGLESPCFIRTCHERSN